MTLTCDRREGCIFKLTRRFGVGNTVCTVSNNSPLRHPPERRSFASLTIPIARFTAYRVCQKLQPKTVVRQGHGEDVGSGGWTSQPTLAVKKTFQNYEHLQSV